QWPVSATSISILAPAGMGASRRLSAIRRRDGRPTAASMTRCPTRPVAPANMMRRSGAFRSDIRKPLGRLAKYLAVALYRVAVGHAGDEVGDVAAATRLRVRQRCGPPFGQQVGSLV